ncbi:MAG: hypothetical protein ABI640_18565 [Gammaproteobacteria bacterium]
MTNTAGSKVDNVSSPMDYKRAAVGIAIIVAASGLMPFADDTTPLIPIPSHNFAAWLFLSWGYLLFLPAVFVVSFRALAGRAISRTWVLGVALLVAAFDAYWISTYWSLGLDYPGHAFVHAVAIENALAFALVVGLAVVGVVRRSSAVSEYAYIGLFVALGWCAFPLFGHFDL